MSPMMFSPQRPPAAAPEAEITKLRIGILTFIIRTATLRWQRSQISSRRQHGCCG
jgi:hypothetical protein